jgi:hypothetical protein
MTNFSLRIWDSSKKEMSYSKDWNDKTWVDINEASKAGYLMLTSGLQAKNGTVLYEGDYVSVFNTFKDEYFKAEIVFKRAQFMLQTAELTTHSRWINYELVLIGNKFENPGMLVNEES